MKKNKSNSIFLGGAFRDHQLLFMIPIVEGICLKKNIKKIILEKNLSQEIKKQKIFKNFLNNYEIKSIESLNRKENFMIKNFKFSLWFIYFFFKSFFINRKDLLSKKNDWFQCQVIHSIWDTCIINNKSELNKFEFISRIKSSIFLSRQILKHDAIKKEKVKHAVIQHTVYEERFLLALMRKSNISIFVQNKHVLNKQKLTEDFGFKHLDKNIFLDSYKVITHNQIEKYWKKNFLLGNPKYREAKIASNIKNKKKINFQEKENVIMLHIFKDSPFTNIDRSRIFADYYSWVYNTLKIVSKSDEKWIIRKHPSADKWGENQAEIIRNLLIDIFKNQVPKNIIFENNVKSNLIQFKLTNKLVTFSGNSHLEASCFGIKPIIISKTTLCNFDKDMFFKPKSIKDYKKLLLEKIIKNSKLQIHK